MGSIVKRQSLHESSIIAAPVNIMRVVDDRCSSSVSARSTPPNRPMTLILGLSALHTTIVGRADKKSEKSSGS